MSDPGQAAAAAAAADAHPGDSVELHLPRSTAIAIYFPGYINPQSPAAALRTLGGENGLMTALSEQPAFLKLRLRPDDPHSHPLFGERSQQNGLVLRIARPKGQPDAAPKVSCVARVVATYAFNGLADYQYLGHDPQQTTRHQAAHLLELSPPNLPTAAEPLKRPGPFLLLPPLFSKVDMPVAYGFKDTVGAAAAAAAADGAEEEAALKSATKAHEPRVVSFYSPVVPPALSLNPTGLTQQQQQHLPRLQALLQQRPAWQFEGLLDQLPGCSEEVVKPLLAALCYQFKTGPWKSLWVSCDFDPRDSVDARRYQILQYRLPSEWAKRVRAAKQSGNPLKQPPLSALWSFSAMPVTFSTPLQLCDLQDEAIRQLVTSAPVTNTPSEAYGWFTYPSTQQMQQALNMAFSKAVKQAMQQQPPPPQAAAAAEGDGEGAAADAMDVDAAGESAQQQQGADDAAAAAEAAGDSGAVDPQQQQQREQRRPPAAAAAASAEDLVGLLGLGAADEDLKEWLQETAAAAEQRRQQRAAAAAAAGGEAAAAAAAGESTDGGLSESDWEGTSAGETTEGEDDGLTSDGDWGTDASEAEVEEEDEYSAYNEDV